jgi:GH15 family glucan-1,4-alpha-glucosidase
MHRRVTGDGYNGRLRSFTQTLGGRTVDAAMLRVAQVGFLEESDPRVASTVRAIARHLARGVLVSRYLPRELDDGLDHGEEGAFLMCSFWLVDALAHIGEVEEAQRRFERLLAFASPVGLMAEEVDTTTGELLGNYPQAFTHLSLIGAAVNIERARHRHTGPRRPAVPPPADPLE